MAGTGFLGKLKQFDAYPKTLEDFRIKTYGGAASKPEMNWCLACVSCVKNHMLYSYISERCHHLNTVPVGTCLLSIY